MVRDIIPFLANSLHKSVLESKAESMHSKSEKYESRKQQLYLY